MHYCMTPAPYAVLLYLTCVLRRLQSHHTTALTLTLTPLVLWGTAVAGKQLVVKVCQYLRPKVRVCCVYSVCCA